MTANWPFSDPPNLAVLTLRSIIAGAPVLCVTHRHGWRFTGHGTPLLSDATPMGLAEMVALDSTLALVADLPEGWQASRCHVEDEWKRSPYDHTLS
ncbi:MAG: hypothetical protein K0Q55_90 [Verrucomicrobia bacterium]|nr:hypothetical protein [Verrucomicrobiota bacterium]